ncbi:MAG TPA: hypothetical protein VK618_07975 [Flavitalea sp.]|nr:hypothetical protein [Flavitalea sp.]
MTELSIYGKNGFFHNIVKASAIIKGNYAVLEKGAHDLNMNNLLSNLELPKEKYPGVFCLPPVSEVPGSTAQWETFNFRILFLCTTYSTGDNKTKLPDRNTNSSLAKIVGDWNAMKNVGLAFMHAVEKRKLEGFRLVQGTPWRIPRISIAQNDNVSGVMLMFSAQLFSPCDYSDIDLPAIANPFVNEQPTYH